MGVEVKQSAASLVLSVQKPKKKGEDVVHCVLLSFRNM